MSVKIENNSRFEHLSRQGTATTASRHSIVIRVTVWESAPLLAALVIFQQERRKRPFESMQSCWFETREVKGGDDEEEVE